MKTAVHIKRMLSLVVCLVLGLSLMPLQRGSVQAAPATTVIAQWTFESPNTPADATAVPTYPNAIVPAVGTGNAGGVHASASTVWTTPAGNGSVESFSSNNWAVDDYYQFMVSTANYTGIQLSWDQTGSGTGPRDFKLAYSTDGTTFTDFGASYSLANVTWSSGAYNAASTISRDLSSITDIDEQANVYFRLIVTSTTSIGGGTVGTTGSGRVDNFTVSGTSTTASTNPSGTGAADPNALFAGDATLLTVAVTPGTNPDSSDLSVTCDLTDIGGSATQTFYDDETNGDVTGGDNTFSFSTTVDAGTSAGSKSMACTISDTEPRSGNATIGLTVLPAIVPIGTINGPVGDTDNGTAHRSPYAPASGNGAGTDIVTVQGVIYEKTLQATSFGGTYNGFFIQNTAAMADTDPNTSDGLFVYMGTFPDLIGGYVPTVGDEVVLSGKVSEYYNMTELTSATLVKPVVRSDVVIDSEVVPVVADPPANLADANRYWERLQGMRVQVPMDSIVLGGRNVFSPVDGEVWVARPDSTIAQRLDPYTQRAFRDAHLLDDNYDATTWDGNGYRILMGSLGIKGSLGDAQALIDPARTFDTVTNAPAGGLNYTFSKYRIEITGQPALSDGPDPSLNNPPQPVDPSLGYSIADYNLENLYDFRNDPFSGCDFAGDLGCSNTGTPFKDPVTPSFDYVPASNDVYQARLSDIAHQVIDDLHSPDILMLQEVENQDICTVESAALVCGVTNNADGKPDVLQELALKITALGGPVYDAAFDRDSSDLRGIVPAFLYRTDYVQLLPPSASDPVLGSAPVIDYPGAPVANDSQVSNPKTLNAVLPNGVTACETSWVFPRAPDIALFRVFDKAIGGGILAPQITSSYQDVYVINNHFKSGPDSCVAHRTEQAKYNAAIVKAIETAEPNANVVVGGDLNVYPRPDDPFAPIGDPSSSDQLGALYNPTLGLKNLWEDVLAQHPESAYSYVYLGMAQTLDQMFMNQALLSNLYQVRIAHINSDFPADYPYPGDVARGTSDHDPMVATIYWSSFTPTADAGGPYRVDQGGDVTLTATATDPLGGPVTYAWDLDNDGVYDDATGSTATYTAGFIAGDFTVSVKVTGANGAEKVASAMVSVNNRYLLPFISQ